MAGKQNHNRDTEKNKQSFKCIRKRNQQLKRSQKKKKKKEEDKVEVWGARGGEKKN